MPGVCILPYLAPTSLHPVMIDAAGAGDLLGLLAGLPDPRRSGGRVHPVGYVVAVVLVASPTRRSRI